MWNVRNLKNSPFNTQKLMEAEALHASRQTSGNESENEMLNLSVISGVLQNRRKVSVLIIFLTNSIYFLYHCADK